MNEPLLLYDGVCGLCAASVQLILRHERHHTLRFAPLQGELAAQVRSRHPELTGVDSMIWVEHPGDDNAERVQVRSDAALQAARYMGGPWRLAAIGRILPRRLRDAAYDVIARHRHKVFAEPEQCFVPPPSVRARFLG
jgi:predicted DCC family thiol-disulfide oxidoreductase YuxK